MMFRYVSIEQLKDSRFLKAEVIRRLEVVRDLVEFIIIQIIRSIATTTHIATVV